MHINERADEIKICAYCPLMCKNVDAFHRHDGTESSAPHIRNLVLQKVLQEKENPKDHPPEQHLEEAAEILYKTTLGGESTAWCGRSMDIRSNMLAGRADIVEHGHAPPAVDELDERSQTEHNPYGRSHDDRFGRIDADIVDRLTDRPDASIGVWVGCTTAYHQPEIFEALVAVFDESDVAAGIVDEERCCGLPQYKLGLRETASELMAHNAAAINNRSFDTLVVDCPECYRAFNDYYPHFEFDIEPEVVHSTQFVQDLLEEGTLQLETEVSTTVGYHDPYELSRHTTPIDRNEYDTSDLHEAPRAVLDAIPGLEREELRHNRYKAFSCGGDVGMKEMYPDVAEKVGHTVLDEVAKTGAETVAVGSPECKRHLAETVADTQMDLTVVSVPELLARAL